MPTTKNLTGRGWRPGLGGPLKPEPGGEFLVPENAEGHRHRRHRHRRLLLLPQPLQEEGGEGGAPAHSKG